MGKRIWLLWLATLMSLSACGQDGRPEQSKPSPSPVVSGLIQSDNTDAVDKPTIPEDAAAGTEYLYDFQFSKRYDAHKTEEFSLTLPDAEKPLSLFERYEGQQSGENGQIFSGEGMVPHSYKRYWFTEDQGELIVVTDYYEPDYAEYVSYLWTTLVGAKTKRDVGVGSTDEELLAAYQTDLYYLDGEAAEVFYLAKDEEGMLSQSFDYAYVWQPFTRETNDIRDITFYLRDGKVIAIEIIEPYELRYVYGYDREAGLQYVQDRRMN